MEAPLLLTGSMTRGGSLGAPGGTVKRRGRAAMETSAALRYDEREEVRTMLVRLSVLLLALLAGCSHATLPYKPDPQPRGARVSAAYQVVADRLRVELDTGGKR